jgi:hypothetical protein
MKPTAHRHHYLTQAYLAAFTDTGSKDGQFYVLDVNSGKCFRTSPKNVAIERDFNRIDVEGKPPDALEQALSPFEERMAQACRNVNCIKTFPSEEDCNYIINLLGLIAIRNPQFRYSFNRAREKSMRIIDHMLMSDKKIFEHHLKKAKEAGYLEKNTKISFEEMKRLDEQGYEIEFMPEGNVRIEFRLFDELLPVLGKRTWSLLIAPDPGPGFICSDHPVTLSWKKMHGGPIGYGLKNTEVFFPLGPRTGFWGVYENPLSETFMLNVHQVAIMNCRVVLNAERHVFSPVDKFLISYKGKEIELDCGSMLQAGSSR